MGRLKGDANLSSSSLPFGLPMKILSSDWKTLRKSREFDNLNDVSGIQA